MTWTYNHDLLATKPLYQVRALIQDVSSGKQLLQDEEITWNLGQSAGVYNAAAMSCRMIAASFARDADMKIGDLAESASQKGMQYLKMAERYELDAALQASGSIYVGGISIADRDAREEDTDRVEPAFTLGQFDNPGAAST